MKASRYISIVKCPNLLIHLFIFSLFNNTAKWNELLSDTASHGALSLTNGLIECLLESRFNARPTDVGFEMDIAATG
jgi:hypothetical protein